MQVQGNGIFAALIGRFSFDICAVEDDKFFSPLAKRYIA